jgi:predicted GIY-YIG superfamily endonuclease
MTKEHRYFVYILASKRNGTLYVGVTGNLAGRVGEHRDELFNSGTSMTPLRAKSVSKNGGEHGS